MIFFFNREIGTIKYSLPLLCDIDSFYLEVANGWCFSFKRVKLNLIPGNTLIQVVVQKRLGSSDLANLTCN